MDNNEIIKKFNGRIFTMQEHILLISALNEARADTAEQIFKELGDIIAFSGKLTELRSDKVYRAIREEDYQALKKEHKVD